MAKRRILMQPRKATKRAGQKLFNESATECAVREKRERRVMATLGITLATLILLAAGFISTKAYAGAFEVAASPARFEISGKSG